MERRPYHSLSKLSEVVERIRWGVVYVECGQQAGTGFVVHPSGLIATARHVIADRRGRRLIAKLWEHQAVEAEVVAESSELDFALLRLPMPTCEHKHALQSRRGAPLLKTGADVAYTGFSFGVWLYGVPVLTTHRGIISSLFNVDSGGETLWLYHIDGLVNEGLSGSPVYCPETGALVGLINKYYGPHLKEGRDGQHLRGTGFGGAVPIGYVMQEVEKIVAGQEQAANASP